MGNAAGSWVFWNLLTKDHVRRSNWKKMVMTDLVIKSVNETTGCALVEPAVEVAVERAANVSEVVSDV